VPKPSPTPNILLNEEKTKRQRSIDQENHLAKKLGGERVRGSGSFGFRPGDVKIRGEFLIEGKTTKKGSYTLTIELLQKISDEANRLNLDPLFAVTFEEARGVERDWLLVPLSVWERILS
jgi:hypothetical protein